MAKPLDDVQGEQPLDPATERVRRKLVRFIAINLGILFIALMAVAAALVYRTNASAPAPEAAAGTVPSGEGLIEGRILLPADSRILSHAASGNRLTLHVELVDGGQAILLYDIAEGRIVGRFDIGTEP